MEHADGDKCKIVFTSPEAMMEFSGEKSFFFFFPHFYSIINYKLQRYY